MIEVGMVYHGAAFSGGGSGVRIPPWTVDIDST